MSVAKLPSPGPETATPERPPVLVFDGECGFCTSCARLLRQTGTRAEIVPWQRADLDRLGLSAAEAAAAVRWVEPDGSVRGGHEAIAAALLTAGPAARLAGRAIVAPGVSRVAAAGYRFVAANRGRLPGGTPACSATSR